MCRFLEARSAELAHAFPANALGAVWPDVTLKEMDFPWFLNEWQVRIYDQRGAYVIMFGLVYFCDQLSYSSESYVEEVDIFHCLVAIVRSFRN